MAKAILAVAALFGLIFLRLPIAFALILVGFVGFALIIGWSPSLAMVAQIAYDTGLSYELSILPLFILMGNFVSRAGFSDELYSASNAFLGHRRGGLAMATIVACGGFSAVCGSSLATAATMTKVAMPPMRQYGYAPSLAAGSIAAGGTLGILIPPSVILVIYGLLTETSIGALFIAGILPGLLGVLGYMAAVQAVVRVKPALGPAAVHTNWAERFRRLRGVWGIVILFVLVMGGIYGGIFTTTEAAGVGAGGAFLLALMRRRITLPLLYAVLVESARSTAMLFFVLIGALIFSNLVNIAGLPAALTSWVQSLAVDPFVVIALIVLIYFVLGCVFESVSMILLTVPMFFPVVTSLGFDPIWFGILVVMVTEIGLITPPVGLNVFVMRSLLPDVDVGTIFKGVLPFILSDFVRIALIVLFPGIALFLPSLM